MPIDKSASVDILEVQRIHGALIDFCNFLQNIRDNSAGNVGAVSNIPARVTTLITQKANFDALGLSAARIEDIMTKNVGYTDWPSQVADFNAVFTKAPALRTLVINNIDSFTQSFSADEYQLVAGGLQTSLETELDNILQHYA